MGPMGRLERRRRAHVDVRHRGCRRGDGRTRYGTSRGIQVRSPSGPRPPLRRADPLRREGDRGGRADTGPGGMEARGRRRRGRVATRECARGVVPRGPIVRRPGRQARQGQGEEGRRCEQQQRRCEEEERPAPAEGGGRGSPDPAAAVRGHHAVGGATRGHGARGEPAGVQRSQGDPRGGRDVARHARRDRRGERIDRIRKQRRRLRPAVARRGKPRFNPRAAPGRFQARARAVPRLRRRVRPEKTHSCAPRRR